MKDITLAVHDGRVTTTSRQIAEHFGKQHAHVLRAIANLECSEEFRQSNFGSAHYSDEQGKPRQEYTITRDGFTFLAMGFTGKSAAQWKEKYIAAFNAMEAELKQPAKPVDTLAALRLTEAYVKHTRFLLSFDRAGLMQLSELAKDEFVTSVDQTAEILKHNGLSVVPTELLRKLSGAIDPPKEPTTAEPSLPDEVVGALNARYKTGDQKKLATELGVHASTAGRILMRLKGGAT